MANPPPPPTHLMAFSPSPLFPGQNNQKLFSVEEIHSIAVIHAHTAVRLLKSLLQLQLQSYSLYRFFFLRVGISKWETLDHLFFYQIYLCEHAYKIYKGTKAFLKNRKPGFFVNCGQFSCSWTRSLIRIPNTDLDPGQPNQCECGSGSSFGSSTLCLDLSIYFHQSFSFSHPIPACEKLISSIHTDTLFLNFGRSSQKIKKRRQIIAEPPPPPPLWQKPFPRKLKFCGGSYIIFKYIFVKRVSLIMASVRQ